MTTNLKNITIAYSNLYKKDYYLWLETTAKLLRERQTELIDFENLVDEIEAMSGSQRREIESRLRVLLTHLLKYKYQPSHRSNSWLCTINEQRSELELLLKHSPSLKPYLAEVFDECYLKARRNAVKETGLSTDIFSNESPFSIEDTLDLEWLPE